MRSHAAYLQIDNPVPGRTAAYENVQNYLSRKEDSETPFLKAVQLIAKSISGYPEVNQA